MLVLVRFIGRHVFSVQKRRRRWWSRAAFVLAALRYLDRRTSPPQRIVLKRNEKLEINVVRMTENAR